MAYNRNASGRGAQRQSNFRGNNRGNAPARTTLRDVIKSKAPECFNLASLIRNSASLRRHVGLAIAQQLTTAGKISTEDKVFVEFQLSHFTVNINGLGQDYRYSDLMLLRAVLASCVSVTNQIQDLVNEVCVAQYEDILSEVKDLSSEEAKGIIMGIADKVISHVKSHNAED